LRKLKDENSRITVKAKSVKDMLIPWEPRRKVGGAVETRYWSV
jgi:hypothetical protein